MMLMHSPSHPGDIILSLIEMTEEELGHKIALSDVANALGISVQALSSLIHKRKSVDAMLAYRLSKVFADPDETHWLRLQNNYDLAEMRKKGSPNDWTPLNEATKIPSVVRA
jgi:antitoxin HigA-1